MSGRGRGTGGELLHPSVGMLLVEASNDLKSKVSPGFQT